jgi:hypothetical protein
MSRRLNIRIDETTYSQLVELRRALFLGSDSSAIRALIVMHFAAHKEAIAESRKLQQLADERQQQLFRQYDDDGNPVVKIRRRPAKKKKK